MDDRVGLADVGEELVAEPFALRRAFDQAGDVDELHHRRHDALRLDDPLQHREPRVGDVHPADVGVVGGERIVRRQHVGRRQRVEQRRFADVGQPDDSES